MTHDKTAAKQILLTNHRLSFYAGSELVTYELACEFKKRGWIVTIATFELSNELKELFDNIPVKWIDLNQKKIYIDAHFDLMWGHHFTTFDKCLQIPNFKAKHIIYSTLSPYEPLECPPIYINSLTGVVANSHETIKQLIDLGIDHNKVTLFENSVSNEYFELAIKEKKYLNKIAIISNHIPNELIESENILREVKQVDIYGINHKSVHITHEILADYDLVITIGRTVQQCFALGVPVFCYDRFGGPGYITVENFDRAAEFNFSGRCTPNYYTALELVDLIESGYKAALENIIIYKEIAKSRFSFSHSLENVLKIINHDKNDFFTSDHLCSIYARQSLYLYEKNYPFNMQVFLDYGDGFNEKASFKKTIEEFEVEINITVNNTNSIRAIRLDPANDSCIINIIYFSLRCENEEYNLLLNCSSNADIVDKNNFYFLCEDPQITNTFNGSTLGNTSTIQAKIKILDIAASAREKTLRIQQESAQKTDSTSNGFIHGIKNQLSEIKNLYKLETTKLHENLSTQGNSLKKEIFYLTLKIKKIEESLITKENEHAHLVQQKEYEILLEKNKFKTEMHETIEAKTKEAMQEIVRINEAHKEENNKLEELIKKLTKSISENSIAHKNETHQHEQRIIELKNTYEMELQKEKITALNERLKESKDLQLYINQIIEEHELTLLALDKRHTKEIQTKEKEIKEKEEEIKNIQINSNKKLMQELDSKLDTLYGNIELQKLSHELKNKELSECISKSKESLDNLNRTVRNIESQVSNELLTIRSLTVWKIITPIQSIKNALTKYKHSQRIKNEK